ncbi:MAG: HAD family hydrolase [Fimbriimonadaceae bacterium]|nr:HAD family hydrolase [Fimbriimonadaceae bacterium]
MSRDRPIAILDRDGVLNVDRGYVYRPEQFEWMPEAREAIGWLRGQGYSVAVVTNQSGIGRGLYSEADFHALMEWMKGELIAFGTEIDAYYFCPHHPVDARKEYRMDCNCRKPKPGMILQAIEDLDGDSAASFLIGDKETDLQAASAAGVHGYLYRDGSLLDFCRQVVLTLR